MQAEREREKSLPKNGNKSISMYVADKYGSSTSNPHTQDKEALRIYEEKLTGEIREKEEEATIIIDNRESNGDPAKITEAEATKETEER